MAATQQMHMKVVYRLPSLWPVVDDEPVSGMGNPLALGQFTGDQDQSPGQGAILCPQRCHCRNVPARNDQDMYRRLRVDIPKRRNLVVLVYDVGWRLMAHNSAEYTISATQRNISPHRASPSSRSSRTGVIRLCRLTEDGTTVNTRR
jgi:hypothetical protein